MSVGDRCFEEKHVFIASKMLNMQLANANRTATENKARFSMIIEKHDFIL
jgi:hypothetical protein